MQTQWFENDPFELKLSTSEHEYVLRYKFKTIRNGKEEYEYELLMDGALLFSSDTIGTVCVPDFGIERTGIEILFWLTLGEHDVDEEHFANYSEEQLAWRDSTERELLEGEYHDLEEQWTSQTSN